MQLKWEFLNNKSKRQSNCKVKTKINSYTHSSTAEEKKLPTILQAPMDGKKSFQG